MQIKVLFVCLGNICRSPLAEAVFRKQVADAQLTPFFDIDSAGTGGWHAGELPDRRTRLIAEKYGCPTHHRARQVTSRDFEVFDVIIGMDRSNVENLRAWPGAKPEKVSLMMAWADSPETQEVPDPYYGGNDGFEEVYSLLEPACASLLESLKERIAAAAR